MERCGRRRNEGIENEKSKLESSEEITQRT
jgi:hypothetical protein